MTFPCLTKGLVGEKGKPSFVEKFQLAELIPPFLHFPLILLSSSFFAPDPSPRCLSLNSLTQVCGGDYGHPHLTHRGSRRKGIKRSPGLSLILSSVCFTSDLILLPSVHLFQKSLAELGKARGCPDKDFVDFLLFHLVCLHLQKYFWKRSHFLTV